MILSLDVFHTFLKKLLSTKILPAGKGNICMFSRDKILMVFKYILTTYLIILKPNICLKNGIFPIHSHRYFFFFLNRQLVYFWTGEFINILIFMIQKNFPQLLQWSSLSSANMLQWLNMQEISLSWIKNIILTDKLWNVTKIMNNGISPALIRSSEVCSIIIEI